jgi:hypothetical protein
VRAAGVSLWTVDPGPPWRQTDFPCPVPQELHFIPGLKAGVSTKDRPDDPESRAFAEYGDIDVLNVVDVHTR